MKRLLVATTLVFLANCAGEAPVDMMSSDNPEQPSNSQYRDLSNECAADVHACIQDCLDANGLDSDSAGALGECLGACGGDFEECVPDTPDVPDIGDLDLECVESAGECFADCAEDVLACEPPVIDCDADAIAQCLEENDGDPVAALECAQELAEDCVGELDLSCVQDSLSCFETCAPDLAECFDI